LRARWAAANRGAAATVLLRLTEAPGVNALSSMSSLASLTGPDGKVADGDADAAREFEAWMVAFLSKQMRETVKDGPWSGAAMGTFADLFDQEIGQRVAETGGFGLQESLVGALQARRQATERAGGAPAAGVPAAVATAVGVAVGRATAQGLRVTSAFGARRDPLNGERRDHHGVDYGAPAGTPIRAAAAGLVRFSGARGGYGNVVILAHPDGTETRYAHCRELGVKAGEVVAAGQPIATVGSTGRSTGPHLHFEVRRDGTPVDPSTWVGLPPLDEKDR
jgi:murein DD-endopeptidase MepM/ murein hydrolase activator NlpD